MGKIMLTGDRPTGRLHVGFESSLAKSLQWCYNGCRL